MFSFVQYLTLGVFLYIAASHFNHDCQIEEYIQETQEESIKETSFYGDWVIYSKAHNKYRTNPIVKVKSNYYSFKKDNSLTVFFNNRRYKGSWVLTNKNKLLLEYNNTKYTYRISHYEADFVVLADLNTYLSLQKHTF